MESYEGKHVGKIKGMGFRGFLRILHLVFRNICHVHRTLAIVNLALLAGFFLYLSQFLVSSQDPGRVWKEDKI